jgi:hypothetical protein
MEMKCKHCRKELPEASFEPTESGGRYKYCRDCRVYLFLPTTCKRCRLSFPIEEFRVGWHGNRIQSCSRCADTLCAWIRKKEEARRANNLQLVARGEKACIRCKTVKPLGEFEDEKGYVKAQCGVCRVYSATFAVRDRRKWTDSQRQITQRKRAAALRSLKTEVLAAYGGHCGCCGEGALEFLSIDHVNGNGNSHKRELRKMSKPGVSSPNLYMWLKQKGYPEGFQVLCHNCNQAKGHYGTCPHRSNRLLLVETAGLGPLVVKVDRRFQDAS